jgi:hypothetical protein
MVNGIMFYYTKATIDNKKISIYSSMEESLFALFSYIFSFLLIIILFIPVFAFSGVLSAFVAIIFSKLFLIQPSAMNFQNLGFVCIYITVTSSIALIWLYFVMRLYFFSMFVFLEKSTLITPFKQSWKLTSQKLNTLLPFLPFILLSLFLSVPAIPTFKFFFTKEYQIILLLMSPITFYICLLFNVLFFKLKENS